MKPVLNLITITKDDLDGVAATIRSTKNIRANLGVRQIIVDSSSQQVADNMRELLHNEENIEYIWQEPSGIAGAFNLGIKGLDSQWVWFLNGRDEVHPKLDEKLLLQILDSTQADVLIFQIEYMGGRLKRKRNPPLWALWPPMYPNWVPHPGTFIKTELFKQYGVFDPAFKIAMDTDLWMRLFSEKVTVDMLSIPVTLYDIQGVSATDSVSTDKEVQQIFRKNIGRILNWWIATGIHLLKTLAIPFTQIFYLFLRKLKRLTKRIFT